MKNDIRNMASRSFMPISQLGVNPDPNQNSPLTDTFVRQQAVVLNDLACGDKESLKKYLIKLLAVRNDKLKFDRTFETLRKEIFNKYEEREKGGI